MDFSNCSRSDFETTLIKYSNQYYHSSYSSISDEEFDQLTELYYKRFKVQWNYLGKGEPQNVKLPVYMGSLDKCKTETQLNTFINRFKKENKTYSIVMSDKVDGISLLYVMKDGKLSLYTRGDGLSGSDVSFLQYYISFPRVKHDIIIRGELVMSKEKFVEKYKDEYDNPRAMVSGLIHSKDKDLPKIRDLQFIAYFIYDYDNVSKPSHKNMFNTLVNMDFMVPYFQLIELDQTTIFTKLSDYLTTYKYNRPYEMDGIVVSDNMIHKEKDGENPKFTIALKISGKSYPTRVIDVEWNITKHNILKPRVKMDPIQIDGSTIQYCSAFNARYILDNSIGKDTILEITKSGDVIPHIVKVVSPTVPLFPEHFEWCDNNIDIRPVDATSKQLFVKRLTCLFETCKIKGVKEGILTNIVEHGIHNEREFFSLNLRQLIKMNGIQEKQANVIMDCIDQLKQKLDLTSLMIGSCLFPSFGPKRITDIVVNFPEVSTYILYGVSYKAGLSDRLGKIGIKTMAETFVECLDRFKEYYDNNSFFHSYITMEKVLIDEVEKKKDFYRPNCLEGIDVNKKVFCFSGFRNSDIQGYIETNGGKVVDGVSKKTDYLIVKDVNSASSKVDKARQLDVPIISLN